MLNKKTWMHIKWLCIAAYIILVCIKKLGISNIPVDILSILNFIPLIIFGWIHGTQRYGIKNMLIWFVVTFVVSNFFEGFSIAYGFPFGNYHYNIVGPRIWEVPLSIMPTYFGIAYISWTVAEAVIGQFTSKISGVYKFLIPMATAIVMTMYDLCQDPIASTFQNQWIWEDGGAYYGVPVSNFAGWVFVVYIFMQIFALWISRQTQTDERRQTASQKEFWLEAIVMYLAMGLAFVLDGFVCKTNQDMITSMAMVSVFTMVFTAVVALIHLKNTKDLQ